MSKLMAMTDSKSEEITIRSAANQDTERIVSLVTDVLAEFGLQPEFENSDSDLLNIEATYFQTGGFFNIVEDSENNLLGTFALRPIDRNDCKLRKMYLARAARGAGLGGQMLDYAIAEARRMGFRKMVLETTPAMKDAVRLYTGRGFKPVKKRPESPRCDLVFALVLM